MGGGKLDGYIGRGEGLTLKFFLIVNINDADDFMATAEGYLFDHLAHLSIAYQSYFHVYNVLIRCKFTDIFDIPLHLYRFFFILLQQIDNC